MLRLTPNATLTFKVYTGDYTEDPATGNRVPDSTEQTINAAITELGNKAKDSDQVGPNNLGRSIRGYLLTTALPNGATGDRVPCTINAEQGFLYFTERVSPYRAELVASLGIPIQGTFQTVGGGQ